LKMQGIGQARRKGVGTGRLLYRLSVLLVLGWVIFGFGLITWNLGQAYVGLVVAPEPSLAASESETVLVLSEVQFWTSQTGVFEQPENAQRARQILLDQGWEAQVFTEAPYAVGVGVGRSREEIEVVRQELAQAEINTLAKQILIPASSFKVSGSGVEQTVQILQGVNNYIASGWDSEALNELIKNLPSVEDTPQELLDLRLALLAQQAAETQPQLKHPGLMIYVEYLDAFTQLMRENSQAAL